MKANDSFRIFALDGGDARGIYGAQVLARVEASLGTRISDYFDLIAGINTGSILAGAVAVGMPLADIVKLFESEAPSILSMQSKSNDSVVRKVVVVAGLLRPSAQLLV